MIVDRKPKMPHECQFSEDKNGYFMCDIKNDVCDLECDGTCRQLLTVDEAFNNREGQYENRD